MGNLFPFLSIEFKIFPVGIKELAPIIMGTTSPPELLAKSNTISPLAESINLASVLL